MAISSGTPVFDASLKQMRRLTLWLATVLVIYTLPAALLAQTRPVPTAEPTTDDEKTIYAIGLSLYSRALVRLDLSPHELEIIKQALTDSAAGKPTIDMNAWWPKVQSFAQARDARVTERQKAESKAYLEKAATEPGAIKTESGMVYRELTAGSGPSPTATDTVKVNYRGTLINGKEFDSSYSRHEPAQFAVSGVIRCWTEGLQKMRVGGKAKFVCPSDLAYGDRGQGPLIPGGAALIFEVELVEIVGGNK